MKNAFLIIMVTFLAIAGVFVLKLIFFPVHTASKEIQTAYDAVDKTINADNAIYNYEYFKSQKEEIDAAKGKLTLARSAADYFKSEAGPRDKWTFEDKTEFSRLNSVAQGIESQLKDMVADYNAKSKMSNRAIFKDGIIPNFIDANTFIFKN